MNARGLHMRSSLSSVEVMTDKNIFVLFLNSLITRAVTVSASPAVVGCHRGCLLPPAVVHVTSHTL